MEALPVLTKVSALGESSQATLEKSLRWRPSATSLFIAMVLTHSPCWSDLWQPTKQRSSAGQGF
jgi:hypothetical protein